MSSREPKTALIHKKQLHPAESQRHFVARQPVFTATGNLWGYELLFRDSRRNGAHITDPRAATAEVSVDGLTLAFSHTRPNLKALINIPVSLLDPGDMLEHLPKETCVLEILEDVEPSPEVLNNLKILKSKGYCLALDDYVGQEALDRFLPHVDLVKVDFLEMDARERLALTRYLSTYSNLRLLAEKVETHEDAEHAKELGYSLMQGYYFQKPVIMHGNRVPPTVTSRMHALWLLSNESIDTRDLLEFFERSPQLTFRLLKFVNSSAFATTQKVQSLKAGLALLGMRRTRHWLMAAIMADERTNDTKAELAAMGTARAAFMYNMALALSLPDPDNYFMTGFFSLLHTQFGVRFEDLLQGLFLHEDVLRALIYRDGKIFPWLWLTELMEQGNFSEAQPLLRRLGVQDLLMVLRAHTEAQRWSRDTVM